MISTPVGTADPTPVRLAAQEARLALAEAGVSPAALALSTYDGGGSASAPIVLSFTRYEAIAPDCRPLWEQNLAQNRHQAHESFGCATAANLAAMIEQPGDLLAPREESPRDAARRAAVLEAYRQGQPTHAVRSADERVAVSTAVQ
jgi:pilus assembly protein CpaD